MRIDSVAVSPDAVEALVAFGPGEFLRTSDHPRCAARILDVLPGLRGHRCDNGEGRRFAEELGDTEVAHLLEHATLEIMAMAGSPATLKGLTTWDFRADGRGVFRLRLEYDDDLVALGALKSAEGAVRWALGGAGDAPDVASEARRLRELRGRSPGR